MIPIPIPTEPILADAAADAHLRTHGYVKVPFPAAVDVADELHRAYGDLHGWEASDHFEPDLINPDLAYRRAVSDAIASTVEAPALALYRDAATFLRVFLCKWPGPTTDLNLHRDWMYIDERHGASTHVTWIPLTDVDEANGPLQVIAGSHRADDRLRGTNLNASWIETHEVIQPRLETITARLGEAIIVNNALVHGSPPNRSARPRLVTAVAVYPRGTPLVHYRAAGEDRAVRFDVDEDFFLSITPQGLMAEAPALAVAEERSGAQLTIEPDELADLLDRLTADARASSDRLAGNAAPADARPGRSGLGARVRAWVAKR